MLKVRAAPTAPLTGRTAISGRVTPRLHAADNALGDRLGALTNVIDAVITKSRLRVLASDVS